MWSLFRNCRHGGRRSGLLVHSTDHRRKWLQYPSFQPKVGGDMKTCFLLLKSEIGSYWTVCLTVSVSYSWTFSHPYLVPRRWKRITDFLAVHLTKIILQVELNGHCRIVRIWWNRQNIILPPSQKKRNVDLGEGLRLRPSDINRGLTTYPERACSFLCRPGFEILIRPLVNFK